MPQFPAPDPLSGLTEIRPDSTPVEPTVQSEFVTDAWLAGQLQMAVATIRSQRFKRLHGLDHWLTIDPTYLGSRPRYRRSAAIIWLQKQSEKSTAIE